MVEPRQTRQMTAEESARLQRQRKDALKDRLIAEHPNEVRYFLRIPHTAELSPKSILTLLSTQEMP